MNATACRTLRIEDEAPADVFAREKLLDAALGPARWTKTCELLRAGRVPARGLALVARDGAKLVGTVRLWPVVAGGVPALMLGPLAVAPSHRKAGIGARLMQEALARAKVLGHKAVLLVGDAPYYARFGFSPALTADLTMPGPVERERFLALELAPGALAQANGRVIATGAKAARPRPLLAGARRRAA